MADEPTNRRGLLKALMRSAGQAFGEFTDAVNAGQEAAERALPPEPLAPPPPPLTQAPRVTETLTLTQVGGLIAEEGLDRRRDAVLALVRPATRLTGTLASGPDRSWIGRPPDAAPAVDGTVQVAEIDLSDPALADGPLAAVGRLVVRIGVPADAPIAPCARADVHVEPESDPDRMPGRSVYLSTELVLPRAWAAPVQALGLDEDEHAAYVRLRARVAERQGVTAEDGDAEGVARHHLLGYPTETTGTMPVACVLASRGLEPDAPPSDVPDDADVASRDWRLLLQLTQDEGSGVTLGAGVTRLYLWIEQARLERRDFSEVWAIAR